MKVSARVLLILEERVLLENSIMMEERTHSARVSLVLEERVLLEDSIMMEERTHASSLMRSLLFLCSIYLTLMMFLPCPSMILLPLARYA